MGAGEALAGLSAALDQLIEAVEAGGLDHYDTPDLVEFLQDFEQVRNRLPVVDHRVVRDALERDLAGTLCQGRLTRVLTQALRIGPGEAARRVRAAEQLGERVSMLGQSVPPVRPVLAAAQRAGTVTPEQVGIVLVGLAKVDRSGYDPAEVTHGEQLLSRLATTLGPRDLQVCTDRFVECLDPDGSRPDETLNEDRRSVRLTARRGGSWVGELCLTGPVGAKLHALLTPLARPRVSRAVDPDGRPVEEPDLRNHGQRMHDALEGLCDRLLRAGGPPDTGGIPTTLLVTVDEESLRTRTGHATTSDGTPISIAALLELADQSEIIPAVLNRAGAVLSLGRTRRLASRSQTLALAARDGGCSFPGCSSAPEWCERHHIRGWIDGGPTDLDNMTLLCRYHHHNFAARGWTCRLNLDRLPEWVPPAHVDRTRRPLANARILAARGRYTTAA